MLAEAVRDKSGLERKLGYLPTAQRVVSTSFMASAMG